MDWGFRARREFIKRATHRRRISRYSTAPGYPHVLITQKKRILFELLQAPENVGVSLTDSFAMWPAASVSGFYFGHPDARYFAVDRLTQDQVQDYARRKGMSIREIERWLAQI